MLSVFCRIAFQGSEASVGTMSIELKSVAKRVGNETHIHETDLTLNEGGFNILLGTTLAGKTTLMQIMAGLERPTEGRVFFNGKDVTGVSVQKRNVSMVYQQFINYPAMTVYENIASPLRVGRVPAPQIRDRVHRIAEILKLAPMLDRRPSQLSGGQQQRTALARALVKDADLVLLDEPLANLDYKLREELREELPRLFADRHCTVVYATTEPTEALLLGGHTATLHAGRVTQFGETAKVYRRPTDLRTAQVFSDPPINTAPLRKDRGQFILTGDVRWPAEGRYAALPDGSYTLGIRPHHITPAAPAQNAAEIDGRVLISEISGSETTVHFEVEESTWVSLSHGVHPFRVGERARLFIDTGHCFLFDREDRLVAA
ncbi:MAG: ABC transporter ATP-binding protein [Dongiaceae bacterium]